MDDTDVGFPWDNFNAGQLPVGYLLEINRLTAGFKC